MADAHDQLAAPELLLREPEALPAVLRVHEVRGKLRELCALLVHAPQLRMLSIDGDECETELDEAGLAALGTLTQLTELRLETRHIPRSVLKTVAQPTVLGALTQLRALRVVSRSVGPEFAAHLARKDVLGALTQLKTLELHSIVASNQAASSWRSGTRWVR